MSQKPVYDLLERRNAAFVLWRPGQAADSRPPQLVVASLNANQPTGVNVVFQGSMKNSADWPDLWELSPKDIEPALNNGQVYQYWFQVVDTSGEQLGTIQVTDPLAYTVDYRTVPDRSAKDSQVQPAGLIKFSNGLLQPCDIDESEPRRVSVPPQDALPDNEHMVIYELPTSWAKSKITGHGEVDAGAMLPLTTTPQIMTLALQMTW